MEMNLTLTDWVVFSRHETIAFAAARGATGLLKHLQEVTVVEIIRPINFKWKQLIQEAS